MTTIIKKIKKGKPYYYAVESGRVNGKPRIIWQKYLGSVGKIIKNAENAQPSEPKEALVYQHGGVAALWSITQQLGLIDIIDSHAPKRNQGPSVGHYMILAAINRALEPKSKTQIGKWYQQTTLQEIWRTPASAFTSQRFWDHMEELDETRLAAIEENITRRIVETYHISLDCLLYDTTNFYTWIDTFNDRCQLPQRGKSKAGRNNLRQIYLENSGKASPRVVNFHSKLCDGRARDHRMMVSLALLLSRDSRVPLFHQVYPGNRNDFSHFQIIADRLADISRGLKEHCSDITFVFDKGNNSQQGMDKAQNCQFHFVGSLIPSHFPELTEIPLDSFNICESEQWTGLRFYRTEAEVFGQMRTVVITYSEQFFCQQYATIIRELNKAVQALSRLAQRLSLWQLEKMKGRRPTIQSVSKQVAEILKPQHMKKIVKVDIQEKNGLPVLNFHTDHDMRKSIEDRLLGKTILFTDHSDWATEEIIRAYRGLSKIEDAFKDMKNIEFLHWQPMFHWTDQKVRVHAFYCVLALTLVSLLRLKLNNTGLNITIDEMLTQLQNIYKVAVIYPDHKPKITISRLNDKQKRILKALDLQPPQNTAG
ncbi:MAG: IS1634 family transposase [candidate division Zixibacteria bacterium]|nr:IS1634 family transposase [Candidatus Tariuqbacter arcticus]